MVNLWSFSNSLPKVAITTKSGEIISGDTIVVNDKDELETEEDAIFIETPEGEIRGFTESMIEDIKVI